MKRLFFLLTVVLAASAVMAQVTFSPFDNYTQQTTYVTTVQPPINADGTSVWQARKAGAVVPVKFKLGTALGDVTIASTTNYPDPASDGGVYADISGLNLTLDDLTTLMFDGVITGNCGGGSPRFQIGYGSQNIFVYLGTLPNFTGTCDPGTKHNFMSDTDARFDTSQVGGTF